MSDLKGPGYSFKGRDYPDLAGAMDEVSAPLSQPDFQKARASIDELLYANVYANVLMEGVIRETLSLAESELTRLREALRKAQHDD